MSDYSQQIALLEHELNSDNNQSVPAQLATKALIKEICLSPKPGLVDMNNNGAHRDMDFHTFVQSIKAICPWFEHFYRYGQTSALQNNQQFLAGIRPIGIECEQAMYQATNQVNTHKGGIFAFGLLLGAIGKLEQLGLTINKQNICHEVSTICQGIVTNELRQNNQTTSIGEKLFKLHNLSGARGEAESGYATVRNISLPIYKTMKDSGYDEETCLLQAMLHLLAYNQDTNLVSRGGLEGLTFAQQEAKKLIKLGGMTHANVFKLLNQLDEEFIKRNLSPGGTADLIAITWFLSQY
ncbi:triphosphoribosyl-dephospho-CoA synthase CitG [Gilliamella sp. B2776]|uniref:triphosphoribosyl-dephospho-CoA synthase CitG n=1 Tax=unclassified Gilliamella TaxID=2685620 RepID=UPI00226A2D39|nr:MULTISPECIES: triphosphoribosyl-dephospho-CoA synthase CitG [unclassified Gilliamella]MCX8649253.1 triphosphoribosyl-dephospho-CoA synthase CitG [Gilliamella sp. B2779]MCX8655133.1 triphosphoribosyl-dephospho-CoA synthase CitG [Gilliamella sp. B2737]MCX8655905.1 triphosphoribosyl-dephospho-CoA synthase CitG [Gilliamella sp. B2894]MCX8664009.1 triphosphoribosyl-dephospho-CoA synthase CitG [Gilliamella sp. B2887]MCX8691252.1 triphosphoribosyl-dephospho-CoA synthase CitG [Gilliamella sp. B2776